MRALLRRTSMAEGVLRLRPWQAFARSVRTLWTEFRTTLYLFRREKVFKYFLLIVGFTVVCGIIFVIMERPALEAKLASIPGERTFLQYFVAGCYWAIVTIATCGYGDISPATTAGQVFVMLTLYLSIATVALFTANLTSALTAKKIKEGRGLMDASQVTNHIVICGWKKQMDQFLKEMFQRDPDLRARDVVVVANVNPDAVDVFRQQNPDFIDILILRGEYYNENVLKLANVRSARKVVILADETTDASMTEIDSKTVIAAMTVNTLNRGVHVCAELLDAKFEQYLQNAHVAEIIYANEYGRAIMTSSVAAEGIGKVVNALLGFGATTTFRMIQVPREYEGKTVGEFRLHLRGQEGRPLLLGLLENIGSYHEMKRTALREAQKTPNIPALVRNLREVKKIESNFPNLNPPDDYAIPRNARAIVIVRQEEGAKA